VLDNESYTCPTGFPSAGDLCVSSTEMLSWTPGLDLQNKNAHLRCLLLGLCTPCLPTVLQSSMIHSGCLREILPSELSPGVQDSISVLDTHRSPVLGKPVGQVYDSLSNTNKSTDWQDVLVKWYYLGHVGGVDSIQEALLYVSVEHDLNVKMRLLVHVKLDVID